jgi:hypothetical protein
VIASTRIALIDGSAADSLLPPFWSSHLISMVSALVAVRAPCVAIKPLKPLASPVLDSLMFVCEFPSNRTQSNPSSLGVPLMTCVVAFSAYLPAGTLSVSTVVLLVLSAIRGPWVSVASYRSVGFASLPRATAPDAISGSP